MDRDREYVKGRAAGSGVDWIGDVRDMEREGSG